MTGRPNFEAFVAVEVKAKAPPPTTGFSLRPNVALVPFQENM